MSDKKEMVERRKQCRVAEQQGNVWWGGALDSEMKRRLELIDRPKESK